MLNHQQFIEINGIDIFYGNVGIYESTTPSFDVKGLIIRNCELAYFGYPEGVGMGIHAFYSNSLIENNVIHDCGRRGISLIMKGNNFNVKKVIIQKNTFYHGYHTTSVVLQGTSGYSEGCDSLYICNNLIYDAPDYAPPAYPMQMFLSDQEASNSMTNIFVYGNVFKYSSGAAINNHGIESLNICNNTFYGHNEKRKLPSAFLFGTGSHMNVKNNIFYSQLTYDTNDNGLSYLLGASSDFSIINSDYNCYYRATSGLVLIKCADPYLIYMTSNSSALQSTYGWEKHSVFADPKLLSSDLSLQSGSPCILKGINVGLPYVGAAPDIGAFQTNTLADQAEITSFTLPGQVGNTVINSVSKTIGIKLPYGTSAINLVASYALSIGATAKIGNIQQVSGVTTNSFVTSLVYVVTAKNGITTKQWTIMATTLPKGGSQTINLKSGWNIVSFNVLPFSKDFNEIFQPLIQSGVLVKIQDEKGNFMVNSIDGWYSNLDSIDIRKGYNVKVSADAQLTLVGQPALINNDIPLSLGFNIIGYPWTYKHDALSSFQTLTNEGSLIKVLDEAGKFIIKNGSNWFCGIDSLQPGKGYSVIVNRNTSINFGSLKSVEVVTSEMSQSATYFHKTYTGKPYAPMNFILRNLSKSNLNLSVGDEIGIFDGTACVGNQVFDGTNIFGLSAGMMDPTSQISGFKPGDTIHFQIWKSIDQVLIKNITGIFLNNSSCIFASQGTAVIELQAQMATSEPVIKQDVLGLTNYPNPFIDYTSFEFSLNKNTMVSLEIYDLLGKKVTEITNQNYEQGVHSVIWNGTNQNGKTVNPGMYIYYFRAGNFISSKKIIFGNF